MARKLYDEEVINKVYKSIEIHLNLLEESNVYLKDSYNKDRIEKSIEHLQESLRLLRPLEDELKEKKRQAFANYKKAKADLSLYKSSDNADPKVIEDMENKVDLFLKLYIAYKG